MIVGVWFLTITALVFGYVVSMGLCYAILKGRGWKDGEPGICLGSTFWPVFLPIWGGVIIGWKIVESVRNRRELRANPPPPNVKPAPHEKTHRPHQYR